MIWTRGLLVLGLVGCSSDPARPTQGSPTGTTTGTTTGTSTTGDTDLPTTSPDTWFTGPPPRNVLVLSLDTTRKDHMGRYALTPETRGLTPFLDQLAAEGVALDDLTQCSNWTMAGTGCTISGAGQLERAAARGMVPYLGPSQIEAPYPREGEPHGPTPFLASWLGEAGYRTAFATANDYFGPPVGADQGHERVATPYGQSATRVWEAGRPLLEGLLAETPEAPWFLHLHFFEPHHTYVPPAEYLEGLDALDPIPYDLTTRPGHNQAALAYESPNTSDAEKKAILDHMTLRYRGEIAWFDAQLATIFADMDQRGLLDDALVVFFTDHGEAFWDHGEQLHARHLHHEENDAIGFFWAKDIVPLAWTEPTHITDLVPTILSLQGIAIPPEVTGFPIGHAPPGRVRMGFTGAFEGVVQMAELDGRKLHFTWKTGNGDPREPRWGGTGLAYYDRSVDPLETVSLYDPDHIQPELLQLWNALLPEIRLAEPFAATDPRDVRPEWPEGLPH